MGRRRGLTIALARVLSNPARLLRRLLQALPGLPIDLKLALDLYERPHYAYGIAQAARQAQALGIPAITCIEFGVGTGRGLLAMESIAGDISRHTGVAISVVGFDAATGLPPPGDYRDLPYLYQGGFYAMDEGALRARLTHASLLIGPVRDTVAAFVESLQAPVGFIACDLDYYSSTVDSFAVFDGEHVTYLPRVVCYFDDLANSDAMQCAYTGQELAIADFNDRHESVKIGQIRGLTWSRAIPAPWNDQMYACHFFTHPLYNTHVVMAAADYVKPLSESG